MPLARNLQKTGLALELMVRASASSGGSSEGGEEAAAATATGLSQLLARKEAELLSLPVEVLHALARACRVHMYICLCKRTHTYSLLEFTLTHIAVCRRRLPGPRRVPRRRGQRRGPQALPPGAQAGRSVRPSIPPMRPATGLCVALTHPHRQ